MSSHFHCLSSPPRDNNSPKCGRLGVLLDLYRTPSTLNFPRLKIHHHHDTRQFPLDSRSSSTLKILCEYIFKMDILRSTLQPLTQNLPPPIVNIGVSLLGESCYKVLLHDIDLSNSQCVKLGISKALGVAIITTASVVKVPQILKLLSSKSATGLSFLSYLLETTAYIISLAYNYRKGFAFSTYGETGLILVQNVVIAVLILNYSGQKGAAAAFVAWLAVTATSLFKEDILDMETLGYLQAGAGVLGIASKLPAIATVWREGSTGQLSAFAVRYHFHSTKRTVHGRLFSAFTTYSSSFSSQS